MALKSFHSVSRCSGFLHLFLLSRNKAPVVLLCWTIISYPLMEVCIPRFRWLRTGLTFPRNFLLVWVPPSIDEHRETWTLQRDESDCWTRNLALLVAVITVPVNILSVNNCAALASKCFDFQEVYEHGKLAQKDSDCFSTRKHRVDLCKLALSVVFLKSCSNEFWKFKCPWILLTNTFARFIREQSHFGKYSCSL